MHFLKIYWNKGFFCNMKLTTRLRDLLYRTEGLSSVYTSQQDTAIQV